MPIREAFQEYWPIGATYCAVLLLPRCLPPLPQEILDEILKSPYHAGSFQGAGGHTRPRLLRHPQAVQISTYQRRLVHPSFKKERWNTFPSLVGHRPRRRKSAAPQPTGGGPRCPHRGGIGATGPQNRGEREQKPRPAPTISEQDSPRLTSGGRERPCAHPRHPQGSSMGTQHEDYDVHIKLLMLGDTGVGCVADLCGAPAPRRNGATPLERIL